MNTDQVSHWLSILALNAIPKGENDKDLPGGCDANIRGRLQPVYKVVIEINNEMSKMKQHTNWQVAVGAGRRETSLKDLKINGIC